MINKNYYKYLIGGYTNPRVVVYASMHSPTYINAQPSNPWEKWRVFNEIFLISNIREDDK